MIVDEWHELLGSKRGVQVQLALARLRRWNPALITWGVSATLGNLQQAQDVLLGEHNSGVLVEGKVRKRIVVDSLIPLNPDALSLGRPPGHPDAAALDRAKSRAAPPPWCLPIRARRLKSGTST